MFTLGCCQTKTCLFACGAHYLSQVFQVGIVCHCIFDKKYVVKVIQVCIRVHCKCWLEQVLLWQIQLRFTHSPVARGSCCIKIVALVDLVCFAKKKNIVYASRILPRQGLALHPGGPLGAKRTILHFCVETS